MNILILGDIVGPSGVEAIKRKLPELIKKKKSILLLLMEKMQRIKDAA